MNNFIHFKSVTDSGFNAASVYADKALYADLDRESCPYCGNTGCTRHGYYTRQCRDISGGEIVITHFRMLRAKCRKCGRTHAVRFGLFEPYHQYSTALIKEVRRISGSVSASIMQICDSLPICPRTISRWRSKRHNHAILLAGTGGTPDPVV